MYFEVKPDTSTINVVIYGCCLANKFVDALGWLKKMEGFGRLPDNITYYIGCFV